MIAAKFAVPDLHFVVVGPCRAIFEPRPLPILGKTGHAYVISVGGSAS